MKRILTATTLLILCVVAYSFWASLSETPTYDKHGKLQNLWHRMDQPRPQINVVVIGADTLRVDGLGCYGAPGNPSPNLDQLALESTRFDNVTSAACWTLPSFASMFTGLYPEAHGATAEGAKLASDLITFPEIMESAGFRTAAFTGRGWLRERFGFDRGFQTFVEENESGRFDDSMPKALEWLRKNDGDPFLLFVHGYDVHRPYHPQVRPTPPANFEAPKEELAKDILSQLDQGKTLDDFNLSDVILSYMTIHEAGMAPAFREWRALKPAGSVEQLWKKEQTFAQDVDWARRNYDAEVREMDSWIGQLLEQLRTTGELENTLILLVSDHGEEFMEHDGIDHRNVTQEVVHVPMIIHAPASLGGNPTAVVEENVSGLDIFATILDYCSLTLPAACQSRSLRPLIDGRSLAPQPTFAFATRSPKMAVRHLNWKLIAQEEPESGDYSTWLYDLEQDPKEQRPNADPVKLEALLGLLRQKRRECLLLSHVFGVSTAPMDDATLAELRELGYF